MNESSLSWSFCCCQGHNFKIKMAGKLGITNKFRASTQNLKDWKQRGKPTGHTKTSLSGWDVGEGEILCLSNKCDQNLSTAEQFRKQRGKNLGRVSSGFEGPKLGKCFESHKGSSGSLAFYLLTPNTLHSSSSQHPKWRKQTFQDKNKEAGARSGAKGHETEKHEVEEEILSCAGAKQVWGEKEQLKTFQACESFVQVKKENFSGLFSPGDNTVTKWKQDLQCT